MLPFNRGYHEFGSPLVLLYRYWMSVIVIMTHNKPLHEDSALEIGVQAYEAGPSGLAELHVEQYIWSQSSR